MDLGEIPITEALRGHGYKNFFAGKWCLDTEDRGICPKDQEELE
jgi:hypothetical protein